MSKQNTVLLTTLILAVAAAAGAVQMDVSAGFGGVCKQGSWTPINVRLRNPSQDRVKGALARVDPISETADPFKTRVDLPGPSDKSFTHYVRLDHPTGEMRVGLWPERGEAVQSAATVNVAPAGSVVVVVTGPQRAALNYLSGAAIPISELPRLGNVQNPPGTSPKQAVSVHPGWVDPSGLPDRPVGYDGVDLLVLSEVAPARLTTKQSNALKMWVASGGTLVVNGGANFQALQNDFYSDILPAEVTGAAELPALTALESRYRHPVPPGAVVITTVRPKADSSSLVSQDGRPLVVRGTYGLGCVYFVAFDYTTPAMKGWDGQTAMWKEIITTTTAQMPIAYEPEQEDQYNYGYQSGPTSIMGVARDIPSMSTPSIEVMAIFLLAYLLCLVPLNYFVLNRLKRRELGWVTTPAIILLFTFGAYGMGYAMKGGKLLFKNVTIVESGVNQRYASALSYTGLFSPARRSYDLEVDDPYAIVWDSTQPEDNYGRRARPRTKVLLDETTALPDVRMDMWSMRTFVIKSACDMGGAVDASLVFDWQGRRLNGTIRNDTDYDLDSCVVAFGDVTANVGRISRKSAVEVAKPIDTLRIMPASTKDPREQLRLTALAKLHQTYRPVLVGISKQTPTALKLDSGREETTQVTCMVCWLPQPSASATSSDLSVPVAEEFSGTIVENRPGGMPGMQPSPGAPAGTPSPNTYYVAEFNLSQLSRGHRLVLSKDGSRVYDVQSARWRRLDKLQVVVGAANRGKVVRVEAMNCRYSRWDRLGRPERKESATFAVTNPAGHISDGKVRIRITAAAGTDAQLRIRVVAKGGEAQ